MGFNPPPGKFPAKLMSVSAGWDSENPDASIPAIIVLSASPKDAAYLLAEVGLSGTLEWTPSTTAPIIDTGDVSGGPGK